MTSKYLRLPAWGHSLGETIFPLMMCRDGYFEPIGTAFSISPLGIFLTAMHVSDQAYKHRLKGNSSSMLDDPRIKSALGKSFNSSDPYSPNYVDVFAVCYLSVPERQNKYVAFGCPGTCSSVDPTDISILAIRDVFPSASFADHTWKSFSISPMMPKVGDSVHCIGHCNYTNESKMHEDDFNRMNSNEIANAFPHDFLVSEGEITDVYTQNYTDGFGDGPCFKVSCKLEHGQSGGPVINSDGYVCGINMGPALDSDDSSLASCLWPSLGGKFRIPSKMYKKHEIGEYVSLNDLINKNFIQTDGSIRNRVEQLDSEGNVKIYPAEAAIHFYEDDSVSLPENVHKEAYDFKSVYRNRRESEN